LCYFICAFNLAIPRRSFKAISYHLLLLCLLLCSLKVFLFYIESQM
jgi:hypothetical protein